MRKANVKRVQNEYVAEGEKPFCSTSHYFIEVQAPHCGWQDSFTVPMGGKKSDLKLEHVPGTVF